MLMLTLFLIILYEMFSFRKIKDSYLFKNKKCKQCFVLRKIIMLFMMFLLIQSFSYWKIFCNVYVSFSERIQLFFTTAYEPYWNTKGIFCTIVIVIIWAILLNKSFQLECKKIRFSRAMPVVIVMISFTIVGYLLFNLYNYHEQMRIFSYGKDYEIEKIAQISSGRFNSDIIFKTYKNKNTPLHLAAKEGNVYAVRAIITLADSNRVHFADTSRKEFDRILLAKNKYGKTPYDIAIDNKKYYVANLIKSINLIPDIRDTSKTTEEIINIIEKNKLILNSNLLLNDANLLDYACMYMRVDFVKYLLNNGVNPNNKISNLYSNGISMSSTLQIAAYNMYRHYPNYNSSKAKEDAQKQHKIIKLLLENKADPNLYCLRGKTPFLFACSAGNINTIALMLKYNAKIDITNVNDLGPLEF